MICTGHHIQVVFHTNHCVALPDEGFKRLQELRHIMEMQACGGLVKNEHRVTHPVTFGQKRTQFDPLCFSATERSGTLSDGDITQAHVQQWPEFSHNAPIGSCGFFSGRKELNGIGYGHAQHVVNVHPVYHDLEHRVGEALSLASVTGQGHIGHELHANGHPPFAFAGFAAPTRSVEAEHRWLVASVSRHGLRREKAAHIVPSLHVGGWVGAAALANGVLVHKLHHFDAVKRPGQTIADPRPVSTQIQVTGEQGV